MLPEGTQIGYECENGHVNAGHDVNHAAEAGKRCVCPDCGSLITRTLIPVYRCDQCGHSWGYTGDADRPTCPECKGKRVNPVAEADT